MVAVFTGNGLGLFNTSLTQLGSALGGSGGLGQDRSRQLVNLATGNLLLHAQDEFVTNNGVTLAMERTYNSRGLLAEVGSDGWVTGFERRIVLHSGALNTAGSVVRRYMGDGSFQTYTFVSTDNYVSTDGDGAHDTLMWEAGGSTWRYRNGTTRLYEVYKNHADPTLQGRLDSIQDWASGGLWSVMYTSNRISAIRSRNPGTGNPTGDGFLFAYDASGRLASVSTSDAGITRMQVSYAYDAAGRLVSLTTDLTPEVTTDNTWDSTTPANNNGRLYRTEYTYEPGTLRLSSLKQSDGTLVSYTYHADGRVKTVTLGDGNPDDSDGLGETTIYTYAAGTTTVTDSLNRAWVYSHDASGQLTSLTGPPVSGQSDVTTYQYDAAGNVTQIKTVRGAQTLELVDYQYDQNGNVTWEWDAQGNAVSRTYDPDYNHVLAETRYTGVDPDRTGTSLPVGGMTTIYVYAGELLCVVINPLGEVTEHNYTSDAFTTRITSTRQYLGATYTGAEHIYPGYMLDEMIGWLTEARKANSTLTEYNYDLWGRLAQRTDYASVDPTTGTGVLDAGTDITRYAYDVHGALRQQITVRGTGRTLSGATGTGSEVTDYSYDGMGRLLSVLNRDSGLTNNDASTIQTIYAYVDSAYQIAVTTDAGAVRTETRNRAGRVVSVTEADKAVAPTTTRTSTNTYDSAGQLRISQDAGGGRSYFFYDAKGRLEVTVDATGAGVRNSYDGLDRLVGTRAYAGRVTTTGWGSLATVPANFASTGLADNDTLDRVTATTYDTAGRIATVTDGIANSTQRSITTYTYDAAGRLLQTRQTDSVATAATARTVRYFYDNAGRVLGTLDAEGYLTESTYDRAGRLVSQVRYATLSPSAQWAAGTLAQLRPALDAANDQTTRYYYNGRGQLVGTLDAQGYLSELIVDEAGNTRAERRYATALIWSSTDTLSTLRSRAGVYRESRLAYNGLGQLLTQTNAENTVTRYTYDEAGRLVKTESAQNTSEMRENNRRYNVFGELIGELAGEGSVRLLAGMSEAQLDAVYAQYGVRHSYDALGRRIESIDAGGNKTWYFYDSASRLTFTVKGVADGAGVQNALGEVTESRYNAFGEVSDSLAYTGRITIPVPGDRNSVSGTISTLNYVAATDTRRQFAYTTRGQLASITDAENALTTYTYDPFGQLSSRVAASGTAAASTQHYSYDRRGLLVDITDDLAGPNRRLTASTYDAFGRVVSQHSANGSVTSFTYDKLGRQITRAGYGLSGQEEVWTTAYDAFSRITAVTDAMGHASTYFHDDIARSLTVTSPEGVAVTTVHNRHGQTLTVTDDTGRIVATNSYNRDGQLTSVTDALGHVASNEYDARGLLVATFDASGRRVELRYDAVGRVLRRIEDPGTGKLNLTTAYAYDGQGRQLTVTDPSGRVTGYSYDREGRLTQVALDPAGLNYRTAYAYDAAGRQVQVTEGAGTASARVVEYGYDSLNRRIREVVDPGAGKLNLATQYAYDNNDNLIRRTDGNGAVTRYYYDDSDRLVATVDPLGGATRQWYDLNGRLVASRSFAQAVDASVRNNAADFYQVDAAIVWNTNDLSQFQVYGEDGRLRFQIDVSGSVRESLYDAAGRAVGVRAYGSNFAAALLDLGAQLHAGTATIADVSARISANDAADQLSWQVLDDAGRVRYTIDALGNVQELYYDAANRVVGTRGYATAIVIDAALRAEFNAGTAMDDMAGKLALVANDAKDLRSFNVFDMAGRLRYTVDALGAVQEFSLDAAGQTIATRRYGAAIALTPALLDKLQSGTALVSDMAAAVSANDALDQRNYQVFDAAGRLRYIVDAQGYVQELRYDSVGRVTTQLAHRVPVTSLDSNAMGQLIAGTITPDRLSVLLERRESEASGKVSIWDSAGRLRYVLQRADPYSFSVEEFRYDATGRIIAKVVYGKGIPLATVTTVAAVSEKITSLLGDEASKQRQTRYVYDAKGQTRYTIDDLGGVIEQRYDALGRVVEARQYGLAIPTSTLATEADVSAAVAAQSGADVRITTTTYDNAGRVSAVIDAAGNSESYGYDALGNQTSYTNKLGNVWTYDYDAAGRRISETSPPIEVAVADTAGVVGLVTRRVVTQIAYDGLGNVIQRTEDATGDMPRITQYQYDNRGHQIKTIFPDAGLIDPVTGEINATGIKPTIEVVYNALGQAVVQKDVRGNYSYKAYDNLGELSYEVDQNGYVTGYASLAFGERRELRRYAAPLNFQAIEGWSQGLPISSDMLANVVVRNDAADRLMFTYYDLRGDKIGVVLNGIDYRQTDGTVVQQINVTWFTYNVYRELVASTTTIDAPITGPAPPMTTRYFYDELGRNILTIDPENYVTSVTYNALGEVVQTTEYARAVSDSVKGQASAYMPTPLPSVMPVAGDATTGYDRTTRYTYDALGRKSSETQLRYYQDSSGVTQARDVATVIGYDAQGNAVSMSTDGVTTETGYDALGRVASVKEDERDVLRSDAQAQLELGANLDNLLYTRASPYTSMRYDAFGNMVEVRRSATGWVAGELSAPLQSENDAVNVIRHDWQGRAVWERNEVGTVYTRAYDAADHLLESRYRLDGNEGRWSVVVSSATYDAVGQQIVSQVSRDQYQSSEGTDLFLGTVKDTGSQVRYNAFGEIIAKDDRLDPNLATTSFAAQYEYDRAGRLVRSNVQGGVWREYGYNMAGHQVRESHQVRVSDESGTVTLVDAVTTSVVDRLGRVISQTLPAYNDTAGAALPTVLHKYDRWGNVIESTDPRGATIKYQYNQSSQVTKETRPQVRVVNSDGTEVNLAPELEFYYDVRGQLVGTRDANGNVRRMTYDEVGRLTDSQDAYSNTTQQAYDIFGQQRLTQDPMGYLTFRDYDAAGRVVRQGDYLSGNGGTRSLHTREQYALNQNGDRLQVVDALSNQSSYDYDSRNLMVRSRTATGVVMGFAYDSNGNKIRETNALSDPTLGGSPTPMTPVPITNPGLESGNQDWSLGSGWSILQRSAPHEPKGHPRTGDWSAEFNNWVGTGEIINQPSVAINPGQSITASVYVRQGNSGSGQTEGWVMLVWYDAQGQRIGESLGNRVYDSWMGDWQLSTVTASAPPGAAFVALGGRANRTVYDQALNMDDFSWDRQTDGSWLDRDGELVKSDEQTWDYDYFNRLIDHNDLGGVDYDYTYDATTGQLVEQSVPVSAGGAGAPIPPDPELPGSPTPVGTSGTKQYFYYPNGQVKEIREFTPNGTNWTEYAYDASGNRVLEETFTHDANGQTLHVRTTSSYDSHNRLERIIQDDLSVGQRMLDVTYAYDAAGNRRKVVAGNGFSSNSAVPFNSSFEEGDAGWDLDAGFSIEQGNTPYGDWQAVHSGTGGAEIINQNRVAVVPGQSLTAWSLFAQGKASKGVNWGETRIIWYDANGARIGQSSGNRITTSDGGNGWHRSTVTAGAPANAAFAAIAGYSYKNDSDTTSFDSFGWNYVPPGGGGLTGQPEPVPELTNLDFAQGTTGWQLNGPWAIETQGSSRFIENRLSLSGASYGSAYTSTFMVGAGDEIFVDVPIAFLSSGGSNGFSARVGVSWLDANGNGISQSASGDVAYSVGNFDVGYHITWRGEVPEGAVGAKAFIEVNYLSGDGRFQVDNIQVTRTIQEAEPQLPDTNNVRTYWYDYDAENRVTVANGRLVNGVIQVAPEDTSFALGYDAAGHAVSRLFLDNGIVKQEITQYDQRGQRINVFQAQTLGSTAPVSLQESFVYDDVGRQTQHLEYFETGTVRNGVNISGWQQHAEITAYDADGRVVGTAISGRALDWTASSSSSSSLVELAQVSYTGASNLGYDVAGRLKGYTYRYIRHEEGSGADAGDPANYTHTYTYQYLGRESYLDKQVYGASTNSNFRASTSTSTYDAWGRRVAIRETTPNQDVDDTIRYFSYDGENNILRRRQGTLQNGAFYQNTADRAQSQLYTYVSGQNVGSGKYNGELDVIGRLTAYDSSEVGSSKITVQAGDTLRGIAQRVYGNSNLWYVLAEANAITDEAMVPGTTLTVPEVKVTSNDASTFKPFNTSEAVGNTSPSLPYIQPPSDNGCNALAMILIVVVVVVATVFTAGVATVGLGAGLSATMGAGAATLAGAGGLGLAVAAGAAGGAVGAAVGGALGSALGVSSFSWRNVAAGAVTGAITAGVATGLSGVNALNTAGQLNTWGRAIQGAANYGGSVIANAAMGNNTHFSWNAVAASAVGAAVSAQVGGRVPTIQGGSAGSGLVNNFTGYFVNGAVNASANRLFGFGRQDWSGIAADAFGNALGNAAVGSIQRWQDRRATAQDADTDWGAFAPNQSMTAAGAYAENGWSDSASGQWLASTDNALQQSSFLIGANGLSREARIARLNSMYEGGTPFDDSLSEEVLRGYEYAFEGHQAVEATDLPSVRAWIDPLDRAMWEVSNSGQQLSWMNGYGTGGSADWRMLGVQSSGSDIYRPLTMSSRVGGNSIGATLNKDFFSTTSEVASTYGNTMDVGELMLSAYAKQPAMEILGRASPLHNQGMTRISTSSLEASLNLYGPNSKTAQELLVANSRYGKSLKLIAGVGTVASFMEEGAYIVAAPEGQKIKATAAGAANFTGGLAAASGGAAIGAEWGLLGGPFVEVTVPAGAFVGGVVGILAWDQGVSPAIHRVGYETPEQATKRYEWQLEQLKNRRPGHE